MEFFGTWIVGAVVAALVGLAVRKIYKDRKTGKGCAYGCGNCAGCPGHTETNTQKPV